jgi:hypothetical protein
MSKAIPENIAIWLQKESPLVVSLKNILHTKKSKTNVLKFVKIKIKGNKI